jgi:hypothetical protein
MQNVMYLLFAKHVKTIFLQQAPSMGGGACIISLDVFPTHGAYVIVLAKLVSSWRV